MTTPTNSDTSAFFAHLYAASKDAVVGVIKPGQIVFFNPAAERMFRLKEEQAIGDKLGNLLAESLREAFGKVLDRFFDPGDKRLDRTSLEVSCLRGQASDIRCELTLTGFSAQDKIFVCALFRDVTERRKAAQRMYEAQKIDILDKFAGEVAHDMNNLLVGVQGHATLIKMASNKKEQDESAGEIESLVKKGAEIIRELRAFARRGGQAAAPVKAAMNLNACLNDVCQVLFRTIGHGIRLDINLSKDIPGILGDAHLLEQALMAVCMNALDAMPKTGTLSIESAGFMPSPEFLQGHPGMPAGPLIRVTVRDTGTGMPPDVLRRAYEPFFTTKGREWHQGLGLTVAYRAIKDHGGYIEINSIPDHPRPDLRSGTPGIPSSHGTTVQLYFRSAAPDDAASLPAPAPEDAVVSGTATLLLIDDDAPVLDTTARLLKGIGYTVHVAKSGEEGVRIFSERRGEIDLVIIDMKMPGKNGLETFQEIKTAKPDVKAILTTGYSIRGDTDAMFRLGLKAYILKPFTLAELSTKIDRVLKGPAADPWTQQLESDAPQK